MTTQSPPRSAVLVAYVSEEDRRAVAEAAEGAGLSVSTWIRLALRSHLQAWKRPMAEELAMIREGVSDSMIAGGRHG